jgi:hypothetical protein
MAPQRLGRHRAGGDHRADLLRDRRRWSALSGRVSEPSQSLGIDAVHPVPDGHVTDVDLIYDLPDSCPLVSEPADARPVTQPGLDAPAMRQGAKITDFAESSYAPVLSTVLIGPIGTIGSRHYASFRAVWQSGGYR